jgi:hypothetical protein
MHLFLSKDLWFLLVFAATSNAKRALQAISLSSILISIGISLASTIDAFGVRREYLHCSRKVTRRQPMKKERNEDL